MSTCPLQVWLWLTGPSCWLDVYLADITSRLLERVSCHAGGRVVTTNVTNNVTLINIYFLISLFLSSAWVTLFVLFTITYLITFLIVFTICSTAVARPTNWLLKVRCQVMSRCQGHDSPAGGAGGHLRPGVTSLADQVTAGALPDPRDLRLYHCYCY